MTNNEAPRSIAATVLLLLAGSLVAGKYSQLVFRERMHYAALSHEVTGSKAECLIDPSHTITNDVRILPLQNNPWGLPFAYTGQFWTDDPLVYGRQTPGLKRFSEAEVAAGPEGYEAVIVVHGQPQSARMDVVDESPYWESGVATEDYSIFCRLVEF